jgi:hypothetical protein
LRTLEHAAEESFDEVFLEALDEGLEGILGGSPKQAIFYHLEHSFSIKKAEIPERSDIFHASLEKIFGPGALLIEECVLRILFSRLNISYEKRSNCGFADYVEQVRIEYEARYTGGVKGMDERIGMYMSV